MKIIKLQQGSQEWLSWRKTVITATECPVILGSSPWSTPFTCWQRKLGLIPEQKSNEAMERGQRLEPIARAQFIERYGIDMLPVVVESTEFDFLGASLDGMCPLTNTILEIKCGGTALHEKAKEGLMPVYYNHQIQHQLLVTGASKAYYYSFDGKDGICIEVMPDPAFREYFLPKAREFWRCVAFNESPPLMDSDYKTMVNPEWEDLAVGYRAINKKIKLFEEEKEIYRRELLKLCEDQNCMGGGIKVMKTSVRGRIDYESIPEIKNLDLDKYRKAPTSVWKIMLDDKQ